MTLTAQQVSSLRTSAGLSPTPPPTGAPATNDVIAQRKSALGIGTDTQTADETQKPVISGTDTALIPAKPVGETKSGFVDATKIAPNAAKDAVDLAKDSTYGTAKKILYDIPKAAIDIVGEQGVGNAIKNTLLSVPEALVKTAWGLVPQSAKELANTNAVEKIPQQFKTLAAQNGGSYAIAFKKMVDAIPGSVTPALKDYADQIDRARQSFENHPLTELLGYAGLKSLVEEPGQSIQMAKGAVDMTKNTIVDATKATVKAAANPLDTITNAKNAVVTNAKEKIFGTPTEQIGNITKEWQQPADIPKPGFKKPASIIAKAPGIPKFLAEQGLDPQSHIENGNYATKETAQDLRDTASKLSHDTLRPSLQIADYSIPRTSIAELEAQAIKNAREASGQTAGSTEKIVANIKEEMSALKTKYPSGISLEEMHDNKIDYAKNAGYSPVNDPAVNNTATANRSVSSAFQKILEQKAPANVPVREFNKYLSDYYKAADYLDSINGKKAPVSIGQRITRGAAKAAGAIVGAHLGGLPTEFAGYSIGGALEHAVENMPNPVRTEFLQNLQRTNPPAFQKLQAYLGDAKMNQYTQLKLPEGSPLGSEQNPIIPPVPTSYEAGSLRSFNQDRIGNSKNLLPERAGGIRLPEKNTKSVVIPKDEPRAGRVFNQDMIPTAKNLLRGKGENPIQLGGKKK